MQHAEDNFTQGEIQLDVRKLGKQTESVNLKLYEFFKFSNVKKIILVKSSLCEVRDWCKDRLRWSEIYQSPKWFFTPWYFQIQLCTDDQNKLYASDYIIYRLN